MTTIEIKERVIGYIEHADERLLQMIKVLVETYQEEDQNLQIPQRHMEILNDRLIKYRENPNELLDWEEIKDNW